MINHTFKNPSIQKVTSKELHILINEKDWQEIGDHFKQKREAARITVKDMAAHLSISPGRIKRFEVGCPVHDAKLIESAYKHVFLYLNLIHSITEALEKHKED